VTEWHLDHLALATKNGNEVIARLAVELGATPIHGAMALGYRPMQVRVGNATRGMNVEVIEPWDTEHNDFLERFLDRHGEGPHHLTFKCPDLAAALPYVEAAGFHPTGVSLDNPQWREAFLVPKEAQGTVVQLAEYRDPEANRSAYLEALEHGPPTEGKWWTDPPSARPVRAELRRVVMRSPAVADACRLFEDLLQGRAVDAGEGWRELEWPDGERIRLEERPADSAGVDRVEIIDPIRRDVGGAPDDFRVAGTRFVVVDY